MAKNVKFNNKDYNLDENKLAPIQQTLADFLTNELVGTGATIYFGDKVYSVNGTKIVNATDEFTTYLETIQGNDSTVNVNDVNYGLDKSKLVQATADIEETLERLKYEIKTSEGLEYSLNDDGQSYSVVGIGTCTDTDIVIPNTYEGLPVTSIGESAFENCDSLTSVTMGDNVISIGESAISFCYNLVSVTIGNSVTSIGDYAFQHTALTNIIIPDSVTSIGHGAFAWCEYLTEITIPDSVMSIGGHAFRDCWNLTSINLGQGVKHIGDYAFSGEAEDGDPITTLTIPDSVVSIGKGAFEICDELTTITIGNGVTSIGSRAFSDCKSLTDIIFNGTITQWNNIEKGNEWNRRVPATYVQCTDGQVTL
jgi:hypothetical protein